MPTIQIDESELLTVTDPKKVSLNGQIALGRKFAGNIVRAYVIEVKKLIEICPGCMKPVEKCTGQYPICIKNGGWDNVKTKQKN